MSQLGLFDELSRLDFEKERELARALPGGVFFGTSSWTFEGWSGIVYPQGTGQKELLERGLSLYCEYPLFSTVGIDSSFYRPLDADMLRRYDAQLPSGFRCVSKVYSEVTTRLHPRTLETNPRFLDPVFFEREILKPIATAFAEHQGPLLLEFPSLPHAPPIPPEDFAARLDRFLARISNQFDYAVELRDRDLLHPSYLNVLHQHGVAHVLNYWERMPDLGEQFRLSSADDAPFGVVRLLIPPGQRYADRKRSLHPFSSIARIERGMRNDTLEIIRAFLARKVPLFVIANNKAEGSSPLTIRGLVEELVSTLPG